MPSVPSAEPAATGSVASAATSSAGRSPRRTRALEAARDFDAEQHLAGFQQVVELGDIVHLAVKRK